MTKITIKKSHQSTSAKVFATLAFIRLGLKNSQKHIFEETGKSIFKTGVFIFTFMLFHLHLFLEFSSNKRAIAMSTKLKTLLKVHECDQVI